MVARPLKVKRLPKGDDKTAMLLVFFEITSLGSRHEDRSRGRWIFEWGKLQKNAESRYMPVVGNQQDCLNQYW
jgi:hypothetical protein